MSGIGKRYRRSRSPRTGLVSFAPALGTTLLAVSLLGSGRYAVPGFLVVFVIGLLYARRVRSLRTWEAVSLGCVLGYIVLNRGFGYVGFRAGVPVLVGELTIMVSLLLMPHRMIAASLKRSDPIALWLVAWVMYGVIILASDANDLNLDVLKDASIVYYPVFAYFGYGLAMRQNSLPLVFRVFALSFLVFLAYVFAFPWDVLVQEASPKVLFGLGLFGHYNTGYVHIVGAAFFFLAVGPHHLNISRTVAEVLSALYMASLLFVQSRAGVLAAGACLAIFTWLGPSARMIKMVFGLAVVGFFVTVASTYGYTMSGWKAPATLDFFFDMVTSIVGSASEEHEAAGLLASRESRFSMWRDSIEPNFASPITFVFGQGFEELLINIELTTGWIKRSPHNSFVTIFARLGACGLSLFATIHFLFIRRVISGLRAARCRKHRVEYNTLLWLLLYYISFNFGALFSVVYDTPYMAAPVYYIMGLAYGLANLQRSGRRPFMAGG